MKFSIKKEVLLHSLNSVSKALSSKNLIPVLSGIKFNLTNEGLFLSASDNDISIESFIDKSKLEEINEVGTTVIQGKYILEIIRKLEGRIVNIELLDNIKVLISCGNSEFNLNSMDAAEFPNLNMEEKKEPIIIRKTEFKNLINKTSFAISSQETRPILTGINFKINEDKLECISTDSYRLAKKYVTLSNSVSEDINIVIPGKNLIEFDKVISDDSNVAMHIFNNKIVFVYKNIIFQSNLLNGTYPDTTNLIPKDFKFILKLNLKDYYDSVDRASLLTQTKDKNTIKMFTTDNLLTVSSLSTELGKVEEYINIEKNIDEDIEISYSSKYMMEALRTFEEEEILILLNSDVKPIIIKNINDDNLIQLILPIKTY